MSARIRTLHGALLDIVKVMNSPQRDERMVREAGISLDRALFPLLVVIERFGPIGVVDLADRIGRDYTTVSRQLAKLESLGLIERQAASTDRRVRKAIVTRRGKAMTDAVDAARERIGRAIFANWDRRDVEELVRLMRKFADDINDDDPVSGDTALRTRALIRPNAMYEAGGFKIPHNDEPDRRK
jgi:DNA-binding MarR family transcriptional regulator